MDGGEQWPEPHWGSGKQGRAECSDTMEEQKQGHQGAAAREAMEMLLLPRLSTTSEAWKLWRS